MEFGHLCFSSYFVWRLIFRGVDRFLFCVFAECRFYDAPKDTFLLRSFYLLEGLLVRRKTQFLLHEFRHHNVRKINIEGLLRLINNFEQRLTVLTLALRDTVNQMALFVFLGPLDRHTGLDYHE